MRKRSEEIVGRFQPENGITPLDPFTNFRIRGEICFYLIENPFENLPPEDKPISLKGLNGKFIGTDDTFIHSPSLRERIISNCLDINKEKYLKYREVKRIDMRTRILLEQDGNQNNVLQNFDPENI